MSPLIYCIGFKYTLGENSFLFILLVLHASAIVSIAVLNPIANVEYSVKRGALFALELHGFSMYAAEILSKQKIEN